MTARSAALLRAKGKTVVLRKALSLGGANPALNPVVGAMTLVDAASAGTGSVSLSAPPGNWLLVAGDRFTLAGDDTVYRVEAQVLSAAGLFSSVAISPVLAAPFAAGTAVAMTWVNDYPTKARISSYDAKMIDGTTVTAQDLRVRMAVVDISGRLIPPPTPLDKIVIDGASRSIGIVSARYAGESVAWWEVQAKG